MQFLLGLGISCGGGGEIHCATQKKLPRPNKCHVIGFRCELSVVGLLDCGIRVSCAQVSSLLSRRSTCRD